MFGVGIPDEIWKNVVYLSGIDKGWGHVLQLFLLLMENLFHLLKPVYFLKNK
jgi:hypothetical protein